MVSRLARSMPPKKKHTHTHTHIHTTWECWLESVLRICQLHQYGCRLFIGQPAGAVDASLTHACPLPQTVCDYLVATSIIRGDGTRAELSRADDPEGFALKIPHSASSGSLWVSLLTGKHIITDEYMCDNREQIY